MATVALRMFDASQHANHFDYFTLDFNEELSGVYGGVLRSQIQFARECVEHVLSLYAAESNFEAPSSIILVGHSVGGVVARSVVPFLNDRVRLIITLGSPHLRPVVSIDEDLAAITSAEKNDENVTLVSIGGGQRDYMVASSLTQLRRRSGGGGGLSLVTSSAPRVWVSADHEALIRCRQLVLSLNRALFEMIDSHTKQITSDADHAVAVLERYLFDRPKAVELTKISKAVQVKSEWRLLGGWSRSTKYVFSLADAGSGNDTFVATSNTPLGGWIGACNSSNCTHYRALESMLLPVRYAETRVAVVDLDSLRRNATHVGLWIGAARVTKLKNAVFACGNFVERKSLRFHVSLGIGLSRTVEIPRGSPYVTIQIEGLTRLYQAYNVSAYEVDCRSPKVLYVLLRQHVPWYREDHYSPTGERSTSFLVRLQTPPPPWYNGSEAIELGVFKDPDCIVRVEMKFHFVTVLGQVVRFYHSFLYAMVLFSLLVRQSFPGDGHFAWWCATLLLASVFWSTTGLFSRLIDTDWNSKDEAAAFLLGLSLGVLLLLVSTSWLIAVAVNATTRIILYLGRKLCFTRPFLFVALRWIIILCGIVSLHEVGYFIGCLSFLIRACAVNSNEERPDLSAIVASSFWFAVIKIPAAFVKFRSKLWGLLIPSISEVNIHAVALLVAGIALTYVSSKHKVETLKSSGVRWTGIVAACTVFLCSANSLYRAGLTLSLLFLYLV